MKIIVIDGASRSSRKEEDRLARIVFGYTGYTPIEIEHSLWKRRTMRAITALVRDIPFDERILWITKSHGAWMLLKWLQKQKSSVGFSRFHVITIDPHHWFMAQCGIDMSAKYGLFASNRGIDVDTKFGSFVNLIQEDFHPCGARVNRQENILVPGVDHWDIVHSREVRWAIESAMTRMS